VLIPVTGADQRNPASVSSLVIYLGLLFVGIGLVVAGISKRVFGTTRS
jgi:hypothetical protein